MKRLLTSVALVFLAFFISPVVASAQFCQDGGGEWIAGTYFPSTRSGYDPGGYHACLPVDYAQIHRRYFRSYGWLDWLPMAGVFGGGYWGQQVPGGYRPVLYGNGQPLSGRQRIERAAGTVAVGTAFGGMIGGKKGAGWGALISGGIAAINDSRNRGLEERQQSAQPTAQPLPQTEVSAVDQQPVARSQSTQREIKFTVVNRYPIDALVFYDSNPGETWIARRNSSSLRIPRRDGTLVAIVATTTATGGFEDIEVVLVGDGKKFVIPQP